MYKSIVKLMIRRVLRHHQAGNMDALLKFYGDDLRFVFPGKNSWAGEFQGKKHLSPGCDDFTARV